VLAHNCVTWLSCRQQRIGITKALCLIKQAAALKRRELVKSEQRSLSVVAYRACKLLSGHETRCIQLFGALYYFPIYGNRVIFNYYVLLGLFQCALDYNLNTRAAGNFHMHDGNRFYVLFLEDF
jgi:hypothetical protein